MGGGVGGTKFPIATMASLDEAAMRHTQRRENPPGNGEHLVSYHSPVAGREGKAASSRRFRVLKVALFARGLEVY
jgi:hypothetical protein